MVEDKEEELLEGARGLKTRTSIKHLSDLPPQNPFAAISKRAPSRVLEVAREKSSGLLTGCNSGSTHTWKQTSVSKVAVRPLTSLCRKEGKPPLRASSTEKVTPHLLVVVDTWVIGRSANLSNQGSWVQILSRAFFL